MSRQNGILTTGRIVDILGDGRYRASLPNGKIVFAFLSRRLRSGAAPGFHIGDPVALRLTPYDFSKAEIVESPSPAPEK